MANISIQTAPRINTVLTRHGDLAREAGLILLFCVVSVGVGGTFDLFHQIADLARRHQAPWLDIAAYVFVALFISGYALSFRRAIELKAALKRRADTEARIKDIASFDALTGLPNRRKLSLDLSEDLLLQADQDTVICLMMIDLDHFKPVNDTYGHHTGDKLLQIAAERITATLKTYEHLYRTSGDQFALRIEGLKETDSNACTATRLLQAFAEPLQIDTISCHLGISIGIAVALPHEGLGESDLMKRADMALHRAKDEGRAQFRFYDEDMDARTQARARIEADMRLAIQNREIKAYYQPLVTLANGEVEGYEVLARWHHPQGGTIAPYAFISVAEDMGLLDQLTVQLLDQACQDAQNWPDHLYVSLNISPNQLKDHRLSHQILDVLKGHDFAPSRLEVEVTETALVQDYETAKLILLTLKQEGVRIALDDFGTGYSNLNHLRELPFDKLKIDSSFVIGAHRNPSNRKIVEAILSLCGSLNLATTAEGIENLDTAHWLARVGCQTGQGFLFGKAITGEDIALNSLCDDQVEALRIALAALISADPLDPEPVRSLTA